jgi:hypothetical protein
MAQQPLQMRFSYDIWQFGMMIYEAMFGPYWPPSETDASILHKLATPTMKLPHEVDGLEPSNVSDMLKVGQDELPNLIVSLVDLYYLALFFF